jgi:hypothetical protein
MLVHVRLVYSREDEHVSELSVHGSQNVGQDKSLSARALVAHVFAVFPSANAVECDGTLDRGIDTQTRELYHFGLIVVQVDHLYAFARSFSDMGR